MIKPKPGCRFYFTCGKRALAKGLLNDALASFQESLDRCPGNRTADLQKICYFIGITFIRMGMASCAVRSWDAGIKAQKRGYSHKLRRRFISDYGTPRLDGSKNDDWNAFYSIHVKRYLSGKRTEKLGSIAERDMISDLIGDAWNDVISSVKLKVMSPKQRLALFKQVEIIFPFFEVPIGVAHNGGGPVPELGKERDETAVEYDFNTRQRLSPASGPGTIPFRKDS